MSRGPSLDTLGSFLRERVATDGRVDGWLSASNPGFAYPEIGGYLCKWLTLQGELELAGRVAVWLSAQLSACGGVGRDGCDYLFDSAIVLDGLTTLAERSATPPTVESRKRLASFVSTGVRGGWAVRPQRDVPMRWSTRFGGHLLKLALVLHDGVVAEAGALRERLIESLLPLCEEPYLHARAYAAEGLLILSRDGDERARRALVEQAERLAALQRGDGSLGAEIDGVPSRSDVTAQAVRLWAAVDVRTHAGPIARALDHLATMQDSSGGIRYGEDCEDLNVWCSIFTHQAVRWARAARPTDALI